MSIIRTARKQNFTIIDNRVYLENQLSFQAMGLLSFLLSKPDHWEVSPTHLASITKEAAKTTGINGVYNILKELRARGFVVMRRYANGKTDYFVYDSPQSVEPHHSNDDGEKPDHPKPDEDKPREAKTTQVNTDSKKELSYSSNVEPRDFAAEAKAVIEHLNATARRKFSPTAKTTTEHIIARLKCGATIADCRLVIDFKTQEWGSDARMAQYLRPETLFSVSKFPGYLGAAQAVRSGHAQISQPNAVQAAADNIQRLQDRFYSGTQGVGNGVCIDGDCADVPDPLAQLEPAIPR